MAREARLKRRTSGSVNVSAFARRSVEYAAGKACVEHLEKRLLFAGFTGTTAFTVTDATDNPSDTGSLRYAINNLAPGDNTIDFNIPYFSSTTLDMSQGEFVINQNVTITGPSGEGVNPATIDAGDLSRIFDIPDSATTVTISNFTLQNGESTGEGGAIYNAGNLTLNNVRLMDNTAQGAAGSSAVDAGAGGGAAGMGGAIFNDTTGVLALSETGIVGNAAIGGAGGNSSFAGMVSPGDGGGANGGMAVGGAGGDGGFGGGGAGGSVGGFALAGGIGGFGGGGGGGASSDGAGFSDGSPGTFGGAGESGDTQGNSGGGGGGAGIGGGIFNNGGELIFDGSDFIEGNTATGGDAGVSQVGQATAGQGIAPGLFTFVTNTGNDGTDSLRDAISDANQSVDPSLIAFDIPTTDPNYDTDAFTFTITPLTPLPAIGANITIDGYSQPGASANTLASGDNAVINIAINGSEQGEAATTLDVEGGSSIVQGLNLESSGGDAIEVGSVGGDIIQGNFIGTDTTGNAAEGNNGIGVYVLSAGNMIGGSTPDARNVISGNDDAAVAIDGGNASNNLVQGNYIGLNAAGTSSLPNADWGVLVESGASDNVIGVGSDGIPAEGNVLAGGSQEEVSIQGGNDNVIAGNLIGTDATGTVGLGGNLGIFVSDSADGTQIGTNGDGVNDTVERNVIAAQSAGGIVLNGGSSNTVIAGNYIGTDVTGATALANTNDGILVDSTTANTTIGGTSAADGNVIANNLGSGVGVINTATDVSILGNSIYDNGGLGIDLGDTDVPLQNDSAGHDGPNNYFDFPIITSATIGPDGLTVTGTDPGLASTIQIFSNPSPDSSGYGQGQTLLTDGSGTLTTTLGSGTSFSYTFPGTSFGSYVSATATDSSGNTSEFSADVQVTANSPTPPTIGSFTISSQTVYASQPITLTAGDLSPGVSNTGGVEFYAETNNIAGLQTGTGGDYSVTGTFGAASQTFAAPALPGTYTYYALAQDSSSNTSAVGTDAPAVTLTVLPPSIGSVSAVASTVSPGAPITLTANGLTPGVSSTGGVEFYAETNNIAGLQTGEGGDYSVTGRFGAYSQTFAAPTTPGVYTYYALAQDSSSNISAVGTDAPSVTVTVAAPSITSVSSNVPSVQAGQPVILTANGVSPSNAEVAFYVENNGMPGLQTTGNNPDLLSNYAYGPASQSVTLPTTPGIYTIYAIALDQYGNYSASGVAAVATTVTVLPASIGSVSPNVPSVAAGQSVTLTAGTLSPAIGNVAFYLESNGISGLQTGPGGDTLPNLAFGPHSQSVVVPTTPGTYTYYAYAVDNYGNKTAVGTAAPSTTVIVTPGTTTTTVGNASAVYGQSASIALSANVSTTYATVNEGTVTFTVKQGIKTYTTLTSGPVTNGVAGVNLSAAGLAAGTYSISATYNPATTPKFAASAAVVTGTLTVSANPKLALTATSISDSGAGSLRQAILTADGNIGGANTIVFSLGSGLQTISPLTPLPPISTSTTINGAGTVQLSGSSIIGSAIGLDFTGGSSTVEGLTINHFSTAQIELDAGSSNNIISGNYIGTDSTGKIAAGSGAVGVLAASSGNTIGGVLAASRNIISGNKIGVEIASGSKNLIEGNYIGTDVTGTAALGNTVAGIQIADAASNNTVGGALVSNTNTIAFNGNGSAGSGGVVIGDANAGISGNPIPVNNAVLYNKIFSNSGLGISLGNAAVNHGVAAPAIASVTINGTQSQVTFHFTQAVGSVIRIELYSSPTNVAGQGKTFVTGGNLTVGPRVAGQSYSTFTVGAGSLQGTQFLSATVTTVVSGVQSDTSVFSTPYQVN